MHKSINERHLRKWQTQESRDAAKHPKEIAKDRNGYDTKVLEWQPSRIK